VLKGPPTFSPLSLLQHPTTNLTLVCHVPSESNSIPNISRFFLQRHCSSTAMKYWMYEYFFWQDSRHHKYWNRNENSLHVPHETNLYNQMKSTTTTDTGHIMTMRKVEAGVGAGAGTGAQTETLNSVPHQRHVRRFHHLISHCNSNNCWVGNLSSSFSVTDPVIFYWIYPSFIRSPSQYCNT